LDIVSLAGLALAAGMLVDNSIVVLEAIENARAEGRQDPEVAGTRQIATALAASFITTAVVFLPLIYLRGLARAFFGVQAFAIVTTLAVSLLLSLSLTPVLARRFRAGGTGRPGKGGRNPGRRLYLAVLSQALRRPRFVILGTFLLLIGGVGVFLQLPQELVPVGASRVLDFEFKLPAGLEPSAAGRYLDRLEQVVVASGVKPHRRTVVFRGHDPEQPESLEEEERGRLELVFENPEGLARGAVQFGEQLGLVAGVKGRLVPRRSGVAAVLEQNAEALEVELTAATAGRAQWLAERLQATLAQESGVQAELVAEGRRRPALLLRWDALRLARLGMEEGVLESQVRAALGGFQAGRMELAGVEPEILIEATLPNEIGLLPLKIGLADSLAGSLSETVVGVEQRVVPLASLARVEEHRLAPPLERRNGRPARRLVVKGGVAMAPRLSAALAVFPRAADETVRLSGQAWEMQRSFGQLRLALVLALVLVFLTVAAIYESFTVPLVVMTTVPVAVAGALVALWLAGQSLNVMSFLGLILLAGIVVNNAIVLVHRIGQRVADGAVLEDAVRAAAAERYRPILMTTVTTLLGMAPLAVLGGEGSELRRALALSVSGGLLASFLAALIVVPVLYSSWVRRGPQG
jgi:HAE1 family hydrophobic/amphiphilic exporter-1